MEFFSIYADAFSFAFTQPQHVQNGPLNCSYFNENSPPEALEKNAQIRGKLSINAMTLFTYVNPFYGNN